MGRNRTAADAAGRIGNNDAECREVPVAGEVIAELSKQVEPGEPKSQAEAIETLPLLVSPRT